MKVASPYMFFPDPREGAPGLQVLVVTNMYPHAGAEDFGTFVYDEVRALRDLGVRVDVFFVNGRADRSNYVRAIPPFRRHVRARPYHLVHAHYALSGVVARAQWTRPLVITFHGSEVAISFTAPLSKVLARLADGVIVTSRWVEAHLGYPADAIIPPGVDLSLFRPVEREEARRALGWPLEGQVVLFVGQLRPDKRVWVIEEAVARLQAQGWPVRFVAATGLPHNQIPVYMNAADVLVLVSEAEGSPMVIKEAMACNLPIVTKDVGDAREVIGDTEGCFFTDGSVEDTARAIARALEFGRRTRGRERVRHLSLEAEAQRVVRVYEEVLRRKGSRS